MLVKKRNYNLFFSASGNILYFRLFLVIATMIKPPHEWKPLVSLKPMIETNHCRMARTSVLPNYAFLDSCRKIQESFPDDSIRRQPYEIRDWKYKFKTGELIRIPLSNIMTRPLENEARIADKKLNYCKLSYSESGTISNEDEGHALKKSAKMSRHASNNRFQDSSKQNCSYVLTLPLPRSSVITFSSHTNRDQYGSILRENVRDTRRYNTENHFRNSSSEISKAKFPNSFKSLKVPFSSQATNVKLKRNFRYKVNASELPRSKTPLNERDPDKISFKNVASFLSDDLGSSSSVDDNERLDFGTDATETANDIPGSDTPSEEFFDFCHQSGSSPKLSENAEAMNLVSADIFTSPPRSVHSSGAFKTSFRLRRAPKHGVKTKREKDSRDAPSQNDSKPRSKLQRFLDFGISTRVRTMYKDGFDSTTRSKEFLQVPTEHAGLEKQMVVAGSDTFENSQHTNSKCQIEMRECNTDKILFEKDCKSSAETGKPRQHSFVYLDKKVYCKKNSIQKSKSDLAGITAKDQTCSLQEKSAKNPENGSTIKYSHSVVIIPACPPVTNDGGNSSDSEITSELADQATVDNRHSRSSSSANFSCKTAASLCSGLSFSSNTNASTCSILPQQKQEISQRRRNQSRKLTAREKPEETVASKLKDCSSVKLTFRKERITSRKNTEFLSKFLNSIKNEQKKTF